MTNLVTKSILCDNFDNLVREFKAGNTKNAKMLANCIKINREMCKDAICDICVDNDPHYDTIFAYLASFAVNSEKVLIKNNRFYIRLIEWCGIPQHNSNYLGLLRTLAKYNDSYLHDFAREMSHHAPTIVAIMNIPDNCERDKLLKLVLGDKYNCKLEVPALRICYILFTIYTFVAVFTMVCWKFL